MILHTKIHEQLAAAHRQDLLDAAAREQLATEARRHGAHLRRLVASIPAAVSRSRIEPCVCATCPSVTAR